MLISDILTDAGAIPVIECYFTFFRQIIIYSLRYKKDKQNTENENEGVNEDLAPQWAYSVAASFVQILQNNRTPSSEGKTADMTPSQRKYSTKSAKLAQIF